MKENSVPAAQARPDSDILILQNFALTAEIDRLTQQLQERQNSFPFKHFVTSAGDELRKGRPGRWLRFMAQPIWRLLRRWLFKRGSAAPAPQAALLQGPVQLPHQYARLSAPMRDWCGAGLAQLPHGSPADLAWRREAARQRWYGFLAAHPDYTALAALVPHAGQWGKLRILVLLGGGGLGDALLFSAMMAALHRRFGPCEIVLLYEKQIVKQLYAGNPTVLCAVAAPWGELEAISLAARWLGIFDLMIDIYCFLPRFLICDQSRIDLDQHGAWLAGNHALGDIITRFSSNLGMSLLDRLFNKHVFDVVATLTGLPLNAASPLVFSPDPAALAGVRALNLPENYITFRDGANPGDMALARQLGAQRTTKQLPLEKWAAVFALARSFGLGVIQVGDLGDAASEAADIDLRGRTTLSELCFVMKGAVLHADTEGGLAHFARAVNAPAAVFFGTTSAGFFGYPGNINLTSDACGKCWYSNATWIAHCPRGTQGPECTASIDIGVLAEALPKLLAQRTAPPALVLAQETRAAQKAAPCALERWAQELGLRWAETYLAEKKPARIALVTPHENEHATAAMGIVALNGLHDTQGAPILGSIYNFPANDGSFDVVLCVGAMDGLVEPAAAQADMMRLTTADGLLVIASATADQDDSTRQFWRCVCLRRAPMA